jgi:hypothetical protein
VAIGLPCIDSWAAKVFQHLDREGLMGQLVMVVGTNAMPAYQIEAQVRTPRTHATRDADIAWVAKESKGEARLWQALREFDETFVISTERPFQAIGRGSREVEVLAAPSRVDAMRMEPFHVAPLPEQEWLLLGQPLEHVVCSLDRTSTRIVVPDPRYFALVKHWLSRKPGRDPLKAPKDARQASLVWSWLPWMPRFPISDSFRRTLPEELKPHEAALIEAADGR